MAGDAGKLSDELFRLADWWQLPRPVERPLCLAGALPSVPVKAATSLGVTLT